MWGVEGRVSDLPTVWRMPPWHPRQRTPRRKPGPESLTEPNSEFSRQKIANSVQPWSELAILRSPKAKTHDYLRYRKAPTQTTDKKVHFPLPRPRKTVCFDRQRPKPTVFASRTPQARIVAPRATWVAASRQENHPEPGARRQSEGRGPRARVVVPSGGTAPERGARAKVVAPRAGSKRCRGGRGTRPMPIRRRGGTAPERGRGAVAGGAAPGRGRYAVAGGTVPERGRNPSRGT